jgi:hypothetical protein
MQVDGQTAKRRDPWRNRLIREERVIRNQLKIEKQESTFDRIDENQNQWRRKVKTGAG